MKVMMITPAIVSVIHLLIFYFVYPSPTPKFLVSQNKIDEAVKELEKIWPRRLARKLSITF
jgi:hypothetical protein